MKYLMEMIRRGQLFEYLEVVIRQKHKFKKAYKNKQSYLVNYPYKRDLGKSTLIITLSDRYNTYIITNKRWRYNPPYIRKGSSILEYSVKGRVFFVDGIDADLKNRLLLRGAILIGYID